VQRYGGDAGEAVGMALDQIHDRFVVEFRPCLAAIGVELISMARETLRLVICVVAQPESTADETMVPLAASLRKLRRLIVEFSVAIGFLRWWISN
jgi:hypothetical protein